MKLRPFKSEKPGMKLQSWPKCCLDCAVTRGWTPESIVEDSKECSPVLPAIYHVAFKCVHRTDLEGNYYVCAAMGKKLKEWLDGL